MPHNIVRYEVTSVEGTTTCITQSEAIRAIEAAKAEGLARVAIQAYMLCPDGEKRGEATRYCNGSCAVSDFVIRLSADVREEVAKQHRKEMAKLVQSGNAQATGGGTPTPKSWLAPKA